MKNKLLEAALLAVGTVILVSIVPPGALGRALRYVAFLVDLREDPN